MSRIVPIAILLLLLSSCHNDEPKDRTVFKFTIDPLYDLATGHEIWIVVRDDNDGELIGAQKVEVGGSAEFDSKKQFATDRIAVTIFDGQPTYGLANVYTGIPVGSEWTFSTEADPLGAIGQLQGTFDLNVTNVPSLYQFAVTDKFGYSESNASYTGTTFTADQVQLRNGATSQLITMSTLSGPPKYTKLTDIVSQSTLNVDFNTFSDFDKVVDVTFPSTGAVAFVSGYESVIGDREQFVVFDNTRFGGPLPIVDKLSLGFLNEYPKYKIELNLGNFHYFSSGPAPAAIPVTLSDNFATTTNALMLGYSVLSSKNYTYKYAEYLSNSEASYVIVRYYSQKNGSSHHEPLTQELMDKYSLSLEGFAFSGTHFILDDEYGDLIDRTFYPNHDRTKSYVISTVVTTD